MTANGNVDANAGWRPEGWATPVGTAEELLVELERQMAGQKDKHDLFIEGYLKSLECFINRIGSKILTARK